MQRDELAVIQAGASKKNTLVDLNVYPSTDSIADYPEGSATTIGDLHGNAIKFLQLLICEGVIDVSPEDYSTMVKCYQKHAGNAKDDRHLNLFKECLSRVKAKHPPVFFRLIGDDLADRGLNDHLTLELFSCLHRLNLPFEVVVSNHGFEFLKQFANGLRSRNLVMLYQGQHKAFGNSYYGLRNDIERGLVSEEKINKLINDAYLPNLKLLSYHVTNDKHITIYSHAPIDPGKIESLAQLFGIKYQGGTVSELAKTIDHINSEFAKRLSSIELMKTFMEELQYDRAKFRILDNFINDRYDAVKPVASTSVNFNVTNIHGHVGEKEVLSVAPPGWSYVNLDTDLGKTPEHSLHGYQAFVKLERMEMVLENKREMFYQTMFQKIAMLVAGAHVELAQSPVQKKLERLLIQLSEDKHDKSTSPGNQLDKLAIRLEVELHEMKKNHVARNASFISLFTKQSFEEVVSCAKTGSEHEYSRLVVQLLGELYRSALLSSPKDTVSTERGKACRDVVGRVEKDTPSLADPVKPQHGVR